MDERNPGDRPYPRYTQRPFPPYRFLPGRSPHPRNNPQGHSYGQPDPRPLKVPPERWHEAQDYLYAIDLFNHGFWWESHEVFEALWHAAGHQTIEGRFYRALIQFAAANLKQSVGESGSAQRLLQHGLDRLAAFPQHYMGIDVAGLTESVRNSLGGSNRTPVRFQLNLPAPPE